jgi:hypothetical protein
MTSAYCKAFAQSSVIDRQHFLGRHVSGDEMSSFGLLPAPPGDAGQRGVESVRATGTTPFNIAN